MTPFGRGSFYIVIASFFYASYGVWARLMGHVFGEFTQAWTRGLFLLIIVFGFAVAKRLFRPIAPTDWRWFVIIALAGGLNQAPYYYGFQSLGVATGTVVFYAALLIGGYLIGFGVFREKMTIPKILSLLLALGGIGTIYQFSLTPDRVGGLLVMALAGLMGSIAGVLPKKLSSDYHELQIMTGYFVVMVVANGLLASFFGEQIPSLTATSPWLAQLGYALSMLIANMTVIAGFRYVEASIGSLIGLVEVIFGVLFGYLLFQESIALSTIVGAGLILIATSLPALAERLQSRTRSTS